MSVDWEAMAIRQRGEIEELKAEIEGLRGVLRLTDEFSPEWRLTRAESRALALMLLRDKAATPQLIEAVKRSPQTYGSLESVRVVIKRLRNKVKPYGVEIVNIKNFGYYLTDKSREIVRAALCAAPTIES